MEGYIKVGYSQLSEMADTARKYVAKDKRARNLCDKLQELAKQARYQSSINFSYSVVEMLNQSYNHDIDYGVNEAYTAVYSRWHRLGHG